jgi:hypothetical protein
MSKTTDNGLKRAEKARYNRLNLSDYIAENGVKHQKSLKFNRL